MQCLNLSIGSYFTDIERFSDRYREKQTDGGLEWQPGDTFLIKSMTFEKISKI